MVLVENTDLGSITGGRGILQVWDYKGGNLLPLHFLVLESMHEYYTYSKNDT